MFDAQLEEAAGFPHCATCTYLETGFPALCFACTATDFDAPDDDRCFTCDQTLGQNGRCTNHWCNKDQNERYFDIVWAVAKNTGALRRKIRAYKYQGKSGWALIFGRVLVGYLDSHSKSFADFDLITGMPFFSADPARYDHIRRLIEKADSEAEGDRWPFDVADPPAIVKTAETPRMVELPSVTERRRVARTALRNALAVPDPERVVGRKILVVDDVFTAGNSLREVARALRLAGAEQVCGLVLARHPWGD